MVTLLNKETSDLYARAITLMMILDTDFIESRIDELEAFADRLADFSEMIYLLGDSGWLEGITAELVDWCGSRNYHIVRSCIDGVLQSSQVDVLSQEKDLNFYLSCRNLKDVNLFKTEDVSVCQLMNTNTLILDELSVDYLNKLNKN